MNQTTNLPTLNEVIPDWINNGFFSILQNQNPPWATETSPTDLDIIYHGSRSGSKLVSPLVERFIENGVISSTNLAKIAKAALTVYGKNWSKLYATLSLSYNPIENYSLTEIETTNERGIENGINSTTTTGEHTAAHTGTDKHDGTSNVTNNVTNNNGIFGFNSTESTPANDQTGTATGANTTADTETVDLTDKTNDSENGSTTHEIKTGKDNTRELTRSGNIGVTTSQQMIESERDLWKWNFFEQVFSDVDELLTIPIY